MIAFGAPSAPCHTPCVRGEAQVVVTTSHKAQPSVVAVARSRALEWGLEFIERDGRPISDIVGPSVVALTFSSDDVHIATMDGPLRFHLGTAHIRMQSLGRGETDPMIRAGEIRSGDQILDTTFGLGRDARVAAKAVGSAGTVDAMESGLALFRLAQIGLDAAPLEDGHARVAIRHGDSITFLSACADGAYDVVLIDPMFEQPKASDSGFARLRHVADHQPLSQAWVHEARRVARRWVVLKAGRSEDWFADEGLTWVRSNSNAGWYRAPGGLSV